MMFKYFIVLLALATCASAAATPKFEDQETTDCYESIIARINAIQVHRDIKNLMQQIIEENGNKDILEISPDVFSKYNKPSVCFQFKMHSSGTEECQGLDARRATDAMSEIIKSEPFLYAMSAARVCDLTVYRKAPEDE